MAKVDWPAAVRPLLRKYRGKKHPLEYRNLYQLLVMVILSAQATDKYVNELAPALFKKFPGFPALARATEEKLIPYISKLRNFRNKAKWLIGAARMIGKDEKIPLSLEGLTSLPGIGVKSASVILREAGKPAEAVMVDIHVLRVASRLGLARGPSPNQMEKQIRKRLPQEEWEVGMALSFLGREICRPKPLCPKCLMKKYCAYYKRNP